MRGRPLLPSLRSRWRTLSPKTVVRQLRREGCHRGAELAGCSILAWRSEYKIATPWAEVREGRSFHPDEFAIALEQVVRNALLTT